MILKLIRLEGEAPISSEYVSTLQIEDRAVFARVVSSLLSEKGEYSEEPYLLLDGQGKSLSPKKALLVMAGLPAVPLGDRTLIGKLYRKVREQSEAGSEKYELMRELASKMQLLLEEACEGLWGDYAINAPWDVESYLKAYDFSPIVNNEDSLLDKCIRLFGLCADVGDGTPIVMVNAKSFFTKTELEELFEQAVFSEIQLLLLESWDDRREFKLEKKSVVDQHFISL